MKIINILNYSDSESKYFCFKLDTAVIVQSQIMRKLNPMNSPSTPPQSATKDWKG